MHAVASLLYMASEQDAQTWMQQDKKREAWSAPARRKITPGPARLRQVDTDRDSTQEVS
jgi:heme-degrading monooxygenase HmoA